MSRARPPYIGARTSTPGDPGEGDVAQQVLRDQRGEEEQPDRGRDPGRHDGAVRSAATTRAAPRTARVRLANSSYPVRKPTRGMTTRLNRFRNRPMKGWTARWSMAPLTPWRNSATPRSWMAFRMPRR